MKVRSSAIGVLLGACVVWAGCSNAPADADIRAQEIDEWRDRLVDDFRNGREDAANEIVEGGIQNLPLLADLSRSDQMLVRNTTVELAGLLGQECISPLVEYVKSGDEYEAAWAARCLAQFGSDAHVATPVLVRRLEKEAGGSFSAVADSCKEALIQIGPEARDQVVPLVRKSRTAGFGYDILRAYGMQSIPSLVELQKESSADIRERAYRTMMEIRSEERGLTNHYLQYSAYTRVLESSLDEPAESQFNLNPETVEELGVYGVSARQMLEILKHKLDSENPTERRKAVRYIGHFGPLAKDALPSLLRELNSSDVHQKWWCAAAIGRMGPDAADAVPSLLEMLNSEDSQTRMHAAMALAEIGAPTEEASEILREMLDSNDQQIIHFENTDFRRTRAAIAMARLDPEGATPALVRHLSEPKWSVRRGIIEALAAAGPVAVPELEKAMDDPLPRVRQGASVALLKISMRSRIGTLALADKAESEDQTVAWASSEALRHFKLNWP